MLAVGLLRFTSLLGDHKPYDPRMGIKGLLPSNAQVRVELAF